MTGLCLGDLSVVGLTDLRRFDIPLTVLFPEADPAARMPEWLGPAALSDGMLHLTIRSWLLRLDGRNILVDTCVGADKHRPGRAEWHRRDGAEWCAALAREGLGPEDIDLVFCTHLHADHVGWNTRLENGRWVPTFPNARYVAGRREFEAWEAAAAAAPADAPVNHGALEDSVLPVVAAGRMDLVEDGWELGRGLTLLGSPGHTPGHMCLQADHGPRGGLFSGDAIHSPVQLAHPDWSSAFCTDPDQARTSRRALLESVAETGRILIPAHFPDPGWCRIARVDGAYRPLPAD